jgi:hypothetical protein
MLERMKLDKIGAVRDAFLIEPANAECGEASVTRFPQDVESGAVASTSW